MFGPAQGVWVWPAGVAETYGRACLAVVEPVADGRGETISAFQPQSKPGKGKRLTMNLDANGPCVAVVAFFNPRTGKLANRWRPAFVELPLWEARGLPLASLVWKWEEGAEPFECHVLLVARESEDLPPAMTLITAMQDPKADEKLLSLQTTRLREQINKWEAGKDKTGLAARSVPAQFGGVVRGTEEFPWRDHAQKIGFAQVQPGCVIYSYPASPPSPAKH